jgi:hypothetical protein
MEMFHGGFETVISMNRKDCTASLQIEGGSDAAKGVQRVTTRVRHAGQRELRPLVAGWRPDGGKRWGAQQSSSNYYRAGGASTSS